MIKKCIICGKEFETKRPQQVTCGSEECKKANIARRGRERDKRVREAQPTIMKVCKCCGKEFETRYQHTPYCDECKAQYSRSTLDWYRKQGGKPKPILKTCVICGKEFETTDDKRVTCGEPECKEARKKQTEKKRNEADRRWYDSKVEEYGSWEEWQKQKEQNAIDRHNEAIERQLKKREEELANRKIYHKTCPVCGKEYDTYIKQQRACCHECSVKLANARHDKRIPKEQIVDKDITLEGLYRRDEGRCYICGCKCNWDDKYINDKGNTVYGDTYPNIEHVMPVAHGGMHSWDNVRLACTKCNRDKSDTISKDIEAMLPNPNIARKYSRHIKPRKKTVMQCTRDGKLVNTYESTYEAERQTGFKAKGIQRCARGEGKTYKGYVWKYETQFKGAYEG